MYKIKPSLLDDFGVYKSGKFEKPLEDVINKIKGVFIPTKQMAIGKIIHKYLETGKDAELEKEEIVQLSPLRNFNITCMNEVRFKSQLTNDIVISGVLDSLKGFMGIEYKTGARFWGVDLYESSVQWKLYCHALSLKQFNYIHIQIGGTKHPYYFTIREFSFYPYREMRNDIINLANEFIEFCILNNLESYINEQS